MLSKEQIAVNKEDFLRIVLSINREGMDTEGLVNKLVNSDFFTAPASTQYHSAYEGGLCEHCLNVFYNLKSMVEQKADSLANSCIDDDSIKIVALFHDISKMNIYTTYIRNEKVYCEDGDKYDSMGKFKWVSTVGYKTKEDKFVYGSHEMTSEYIIRQFIPLTLDESISILHHMGGRNWDSVQDNIASVFTNYPLATLLHLADMMSTYIDESRVL